MLQSQPPTPFSTMNESAKPSPFEKDTYSFREMAKLLAERVRPDGESPRATVDKVRKRLDYALDHGELKWALPSQQLLATQEVLVWARRKWPNEFGGIPIRQDVTVNENIALQGRPEALTLPGDLNDCHQDLLAANRLISLLRLTLAMSHREVARLRPAAEKYEEIRKKNQKSAKRPRKGL